MGARRSRVGSPPRRPSPPRYWRSSPGVAAFALPGILLVTDCGWRAGRGSALCRASEPRRAALGRGAGSHHRVALAAHGGGRGARRRRAGTRAGRDGRAGPGRDHARGRARVRAPAAVPRKALRGVLARLPAGLDPDRALRVARSGAAPRLCGHRGGGAAPSADGHGRSRVDGGGALRRQPMCWYPRASCWRSGRCIWRRRVSA